MQVFCDPWHKCHSDLLPISSDHTIHAFHRKGKDIAQFGIPLACCSSVPCSSLQVRPKDSQ